MPTLPECPADVLDPDGRPRFGAYAGSVPRVDLGRLTRGPLGRIRRLARHKRWQYAIVTTDEVLVTFAIVDLGYASNAFVFASTPAGLVDAKGIVGHPLVRVSVGDRPGDGAGSVFDGAGATLRVTRTSAGTDLAARVGDVTLEARLTPESAPPLTLVAPIPDDGVNVTQKTALLTVESGRLTVGGRAWDLAGGTGGLDYTSGLLARRTAWRWAWAQGKSADGRPITVNLVEGFNGGDASEDAVFRPGSVEPLPSCRFTHDDDVQKPWTIGSADGAVRLEFRPSASFVQDKDLVVAASRFVQVAGRFWGVVRTSEGEAALEGVPGVTEDQAVRW